MSRVGQSGVVVAGGGISGVLAAALRLRQGHRVTLVETAEELGGLFRSLEGPRGLAFDFGLHLPQQTGVPDLDSLLFDGLDPADWKKHEHQVAGLFFRGELCHDSPLPDLRLLGRDVRARIVVEMLEAASRGARRPGPAEPLMVELRRMFGDTACRLVFGPALEKFYGVPADQLVWAARQFSLKQVVLGDEALTKTLSTIAALGGLIAPHRPHGSQPGQIAAFYPRYDGVQRWLDDLRAEHLASAEVLTGTSVTGIEISEGTVRGIAISGGERLPVTELIWTAPIFRYLDLAGALPVPLPPAPTMRPVTLHHLALSEPLKTPAHFVNCHDAEIKFQRVTVYDNLRGREEQRPASCTVEVMGAVPAPKLGSHRRAVLDELRLAGLLADRTQVLDGYSHVIKGFPVATASYLDLVEQFHQCAATTADNVVWLGRGSGRVFSMRDSLLQVWNELEGTTSRTS